MSAPSPRWTITLRDGARVTLRPIAPQDKPLLAASFERLSEESRYRRFFTVKKELSAAELDYLVDVDHSDHEAIIAIDPSSGEALGIARYVRATDDGQVAEVAVTVADDWQGLGLGHALLDRLTYRARREGVRRFTALIQSDNPRPSGCSRAPVMPGAGSAVGFQKSVASLGLGFYAARSYSLRRPPKTGRRLIRFWERSATGWSGRGGRSWQLRWGRRPL